MVGRRKLRFVNFGLRIILTFLNSKQCPANTSQNWHVGSAKFAVRRVKIEPLMVHIEWTVLNVPSMNHVGEWDRSSMFSSEAKIMIQYSQRPLSYMSKSFSSIVTWYWQGMAKFVSCGISTGYYVRGVCPDSALHCNYILILTDYSETHTSKKHTSKHEDRSILTALSKVFATLSLSIQPHFRALKTAQLHCLPRQGTHYIQEERQLSIYDLTNISLCLLYPFLTFQVPLATFYREALLYSNASFQKELKE